MFPSPILIDILKIVSKNNVHWCAPCARHLLRKMSPLSRREMFHILQLLFLYFILPQNIFTTTKTSASLSSAYFPSCIFTLYICAKMICQRKKYMLCILCSSCVILYLSTNKHVTYILHITSPIAVHYIQWFSLWILLNNKMTWRC